MPERLARVGDERAAGWFGLRRIVRLRVEVAQRGERGFQSTPKPSKRGGFLLRDLVIERGGVVGPDIRELGRDGARRSDGHA
jgi:hypothetical protein